MSMHIGRRPLPDGGGSLAMPSNSTRGRERMTIEGMFAADAAELDGVSEG